MATTTPIRRTGDQAPRRRRRSRRDRSWFVTLLAPLASLRLTVALMGMAIFIIFAGTLAQAEVGTDEAVQDYFRVRPWGPTLGFAWIPFQVLLPAAFFPNPLFDTRPIVSGGFWFPGGWLIGMVMFANLLAAHTVRFSIQSRSWRLFGGLGVIAAGVAVTWAVIASGMSAEGLEGTPLVSWDILWHIFQAQVTAAAAVTIGLAVWLWRRGTSYRRYFWVAVAALPLTCGLALWALLAPQISDSSMRILWNLIKAEMAAGILLAGCWLAFRKRAGIVLLHSGVALMMIGELMVGLFAVETQMALFEGQSKAWGFSLTKVELAVVDPSDPEHNVLTRFPSERLEKGETLSHESVPFQIRVEKYYLNAEYVPESGSRGELVDSGLSKHLMARRLPPSTGTDMNRAADQPATVVTLLTKRGKTIGTYLLGVGRTLRGVVETIPYNGTDWKMSLRFRRDYKPYTISLLDVESDNYVGTSTAKNYSSTVRVQSQEMGVDFERRIWMNNPLRFAGETLYQSGYSKFPDGSERTILQIVKNTGWMLPYVACMIVVTGMLFQFMITLARFLFRRSEMGSPMDSQQIVGGAAGTEDEPKAPSDWNWMGWILPAVVVGVFAVWLGGKWLSPRVTPGDFNIVAFGKLPVAAHGRVKPLDTYARNALKALSNNRQEYMVGKEEGPFGIGTVAVKKPAIRWLLEMIATPEKGAQRRVVRIDNRALLAMLELPGPAKRPEHLYSVAEVTDPERIETLVARLEEINEKSASGGALSAADRAALALEDKIGVIAVIQKSFQSLNAGQYVQPLLQGDTQTFMRRLQQYHRKYDVFKNGDQTVVPPIPSRNPPLAVYYAIGGQEEGQQWETLRHARFTETLMGAMNALGKRDYETAGAVAAWEDILQGWRDQDATAFNAAVSRYADLIQEQDPQGYSPAKVNFESYFNYAAPFYYLMVPYVVAALLACASWLGATRPLNRTALALVIMTFLLHTLALAGRIYISGRPPVTNLYSSAIFISWAAAGFGIALELFFRVGFGSALAGVTGFASLLIAHNLAADGTDTFSVLVAVLDTQFWLATHVVVVTLGYTTTFVAGALGLLYILCGMATPLLGQKWGEGNRRQTLGQTLVRMMYGVLCFALLFSFFGTVLGGLWADDSWGRFWGWDPKENGALMIVLWNALVLHARWGGFVKDKGLAVLAVLGNVVVSWSWFGTNALGVGLHSYGFTEGVLLALGLFVISQVAIAAAGCLPKKWWMSFRRSKSAPAA